MARLKVASRKELAGRSHLHPCLALDSILVLLVSRKELALKSMLLER